MSTPGCSSVRNRQPLCVSTEREDRLRSLPIDVRVRTRKCEPRIYLPIAPYSTVCEKDTSRGPMKLSFIPVGLILSISVVHSSSAITRIQNDMGGPLGKYILKFATIRDSGERVIIDGICFSACTLVTAMIPKERICITKRAAL